MKIRFDAVFIPDLTTTTTKEREKKNCCLTFLCINFTKIKNFFCLNRVQNFFFNQMTMNCYYTFYSENCHQALWIWVGNPWSGKKPFPNRRVQKPETGSATAGFRIWICIIWVARSGSRRAKITHKKLKKNWNFMFWRVLDVFLKAFSEA